MRLVLVMGATILIFASQCHAQDWWKDLRDDCKQPLTSHTGIACIVDFFNDKPGHLTVRSLVPGTSVAGGLTFNQDFSRGGRLLGLTGSGVHSTTGAWGVNGAFTFEPTKHGCVGTLCVDDVFNIEIYGNLSEMHPLDYYGLGPATPNTAFSYGLRESVGGIQASIPFASWGHYVSVVENRNPRVMSGSDLLSATSNYLGTNAPGLDQLVSFMSYSNSVKLHHLESQTATLGYDYFQDLNQGHYSFGQLSIKGEFVCSSLPLSTKGGTRSRGWCKDGEIRFCDCGRVTLRVDFKSSQVAAGHAIPFYYLPTLGGSDINNVVTLRGYPNYRFSGPDRVLYQFDYDYMLSSVFRARSRAAPAKRRISTLRQIGEALWGAAGILGFYDAGTVGASTVDLGFGHLRQDAGVGVELRAANKVFVQGYLAWGAGGTSPRVGYQLMKLF